MPIRRNRSRRKVVVAEMQNVRSAVDLVLRRLIGTQDPEYEDLMQSSMENVLTTLERGNFRGDCPTGGWAAVIARNVAVDAIRIRTRERRLFARAESDLAQSDAVRNVGLAPEHGPEHLTAVQERLTRVKGALLCLSPHKANVVFLHDVLGHQLDEVARILGITVSAAQSRLMRGRRHIIDTVGRGAAKTPPPMAAPDAGADDDVDKTPAPKRTGRRASIMLS
ncbi:MAG TPA: RNA polymerase sigma factor [Polyangia bacterium]|nr:RNA polymerase sigma factor [Polyangia bacterium]